MKLTQNLNLIDRSARGIIGVLVTLFALFNGSYIEEPIIEILLGIFGVLNLISLFSGWCPVYQIAGLSTRSER
ncbi:DUF2892 domain-containing protein [Paraglaciecola aquimarina]|uniref:DUF2892 domain-containing protein n=1 Tax=Paraglaciecola algarum TaxID=3050085 RepID=A0ABS9DAJ1_9ALTE|nr:DUF2892 domain-containing protein [Paraglaciecola sp. G1-23]MCF2949918.1 DUF2892 domain-containing protein [Paraglaciecola sp. G1-23]